MKHAQFVETMFGARRAIALLVLLASAATASAQTSPGGEMQESMMGMTKKMESMKATGDTDRDFATMMRMHHQGAIDMAKIELKSGKDGEMKAMATRIIDAQQKEIGRFDKWLAKHKP